MSVLEGREPRAVLRFFEEISAIPRPSYRERAISDYLADFAKERGLEYYQDDIYNIIIIKEATDGYETEPALILQGHMDMVCEQTADCNKDMTTEGLDLIVDGDMLSARGTTLGGDDGVAVAIMLAILDSDTLSHPRLECVFTVSEEVGMDGAHALDISRLTGRTLLNIDSEKEGEVLAGCAGGGTVHIELEVSRGAALDGYITGQLRITGLKGGHSGDEIDKGRANATRLMAELLSRLACEMDVRLVSLAGGSKDNAIPRECTAYIAFPAERLSDIEDIIEETGIGTRGEYHIADPDITYELTVAAGSDEKEYETADGSDAPLAADDTSRVLRLILSLPNGVIRMSDDIPGLVETSLNLGITALTHSTADTTLTAPVAAAATAVGDTAAVDTAELKLGVSIRSSVGSAYRTLRDRVVYVAAGYGARVSVGGEYPAWEYAPESPLRERMAGLYREMYGKELSVRAIHAGLECGIFSGKLPGLDAVSMGPDIYDIHTPDERLSLSSLERTYDYITRLIALHP